MSDGSGDVMIEMVVLPKFALMEGLESVPILFAHFVSRIESFHDLKTVGKTKITQTQDVAKMNEKKSKRKGKK